MRKIALVMLAVMLPTIALADEPQSAEQREIARLTQELALVNARNSISTAQNAALTAHNAALTARYGEAPAIPTGAITGADNVSGLTVGLLAAELANAAREIVAQVGEAEGPIVVTSTADRRTHIGSAAELSMRLNQLTQAMHELIADWKKSLESGEEAGTLLDLTAPLGAVEKLIGVFRSDYTIATSAIQVENLELQIAVANALKSATPTLVVHIDGLATSDTLPFLDDIAAFRVALDQIRATELTDENETRRNNFVKNAESFLLTGDTKGADGQTPFLKAALTLQWSVPSQHVLFVKPVGVSSIIVTAKSWFSLRNTVHAILSGAVEYALVSNQNQIVKAGLVRIGSKAAINLRSLSKEVENWEGLTTTKLE